MTKKLYVGNLPFDCTNDQLRGLFTKFGKTTECEVMGRYAFVHMSTEDEAKDAVDSLDNYHFMGFNLNVKYSTTTSGKGGRGGSGGYSRTKLYVGNLPMDCSESELENMFAQYGDVAECDVIRNYGFVHMKTDSQAMDALKNLNNAEFNGNNLIVKLSTSVVHKSPGVGSKGECFKCGNKGHLSRDCMQGGFGRGRGRGGYPPRGGAGGRSYNGYSASHDPYYDYPPPPRRLPPPADDYYSSRRYADDPYYSRAGLSRDYAPPPRDYGYGMRARSRSPPPGYRRRLSPGGDYDRYYERLPPRDPYDYPPPRRPPPTRLPPASRLPSASGPPPPSSRLSAYQYDQEPPKPKIVGYTNFADDLAL